MSIGDERTMGGGGVAAGLDTVIDGLEIVDLEARYRIDGTLGQGGMGAVLLATDTRLDRKVAIKRILGEAARSKSAILRFLTEAKAIAALNHPNIVQIYDYGRAKDGPFLIMEFVDGGSLLDLCKGQPIPIDKAVDLMSQICDGLGTAHDQGIVHRDIKPANILVNKAGLPKLTDFGLAKAEAHDHGMTMSGAVMGTPDFMPPEQRRDAAEVDHRSDLWSLAATFYQMLTGRSPKIIRIKEVPGPLQPVLEKALEEEKDQRFQSAGELRDAIRAAVGLGGARTAVPQASLLEGQCPACGTINSDMGRKFCRQCQGSLRTPCLQCDKDMPAWDAVCGECGGRQSDVAETRKAELVGQQQQAKDAYHKADFVRAVAIGERLAALRHSRLVKFADWGQAFLKAVKEQQARLAVTAAERLAEARAHRHAFDYAAAIRTLESIPAAFMDEAAQGLLEECRNSRDEAGKLLKVIAGRIKTKDLDGLLPQVERAVALQGNRADLKKLQEQLRLREAKRSESQDGGPAANGKSSDGELTEPLQRGSLPKKKPVHSDGTRLEGLRKNLFKGKRATIAAVVGVALIGLGAIGVTQFAGGAGTLRNSIGMKLRLIPAGRFTMGCNESNAEEDETPHRVTISQDFFIGVHEVTNNQWKQVMKIVPSHAQNDQGPVEQVSWDDAVAFCEKLSAMPAERAAGRVYRLPTEAEWEYAARGATTTKFSFGDDASVLGSYAWSEGNSQGQTHPVGLKKPNAWGLHDTHGNVFEWCSDWYGEYSVGSVVDPVGPSEGDEKIQRGGCFGNPAAICRVSLRRFGKPAARTDYVGFRVAMDLNSSGTRTKKSSRSETKPSKVSKKVSEKTPPLSSDIQAETTSHALPAPAENTSPEAEVPRLKQTSSASFKGGKLQVIRFSDGSSIHIASPSHGGEDVTVYDSANKTALAGVLPVETAESNGKVVVSRDPDIATLKAGGLLQDATITAISLDGSDVLMQLPTGNDETAHHMRLRMLHGKAGSSGTVRVRNGKSGEERAIQFTWVWPSPKHPRNTPARRDWVNSLGMPFVLVESGQGMLGVESGKPDEPPHLVTLTRPILIATHEVTQLEYESVIGSNPSAYSLAGSHIDGVTDDIVDGLLKESNTANHPVDSISWEDANEFCRKLGSKEGRTYRLPTEAEWEWVCRNRGTMRWPGFISGEVFKELSWSNLMVAVFVHSPGPVGSRSPNDVGVYDMFGNVAEWCHDYYSPTYYSEAGVDPQGPNAGLKRVVRGGWFKSQNNELVQRSSLLPTEKRPYVGFRVVVDLTKNVGPEPKLQAMQKKAGVRPE